MSTPRSPQALKEAPNIHAIDSSSIHRITSGQVVVDLQTAVKELVENSIDAGATTIDVKFKDYGLESIEVSDNGTGIRETDLSTVALNHHTSKLDSFEGLGQVKTFGFRGEALSSLCALAKVTVQTATAETAPRGWALEFDKMGKMISQKSCSRPKGTTVLVQSLFHTLPVRRKQFSKDYKKHFAQAQTLLQAYGLISTNLNLNVSNQPSKGTKSFQFQTKCNDHIKQNFSNIFTPKACNLIIDLDLALEVKPDRTVLRTLGLVPEDSSENLNTSVVVKGLISRPAHGQGRNSPDRQFYYINGRPFNPSKISKCTNEVYKQFNTNQYPVVLANFILPEDSYDVNVDPNKRTIFLHSEGNLIEALREALESAFHPYRSTFPVSQISSVPDLFASQTISLPLAPPTSSKRKSVAMGTTTQEDDGQSGAEASSASQPEEEAPKAVDAKKPRLSELPSGCDDTGEGNPDAKTIHPLPDPSFPITDKPTDNLTSSLPSPLAGQPPNSIESNLAPLENAATPALQAEDSVWVPSRMRGETSTSEPRKVVQMTLDTSGASWNLKERKSRPRPDGASRVKRAALSSSDRMRGNLKHFMRGGLSKNLIDEEESEADELSEEDADRPELEDTDPLDETPKSKMSEDGINSELDEVFETQTDLTSQQQSTKGKKAVLATIHPNRVLVGSNALQEPAIGSPEPVKCIQPASKSQWRSEVLHTRVPGVVTMPIKLEAIKRAWVAHKARQTPLAQSPIEGCATSLQGAGLEQSEVEAESVLSRRVQKSEFEEMGVIGQFNLGFIIVRRQDAKTLEDDLFIVDQHASDEKFNFEKLQRETKLTGQRLLIPKVLNLTASEEITAMEHLDILEFNGFGVQILEDSKVGERVRLVAQPVWGATSWDDSDLEELLHLIEGRGSGELVRPSKTRRIMASKACRMSVMIGDGLTRKQMGRIIKQMGTMDQPWACPHGRPTMRWLARCDGDSGMADRRQRISEWIVGKMDTF